MMALLSTYAKRYHLDAVPRWWWGEILALLPRGLRGKVQTKDERLVLSVDGPEMVVCCHKTGSPEVLGRFPLAYEQAEQKDALATEISKKGSKCSSVTLRLPAQYALRKLVELPLAAEENLRAVLAYEMDRNTPFKADQVYYDYEILARQPEKRRMEVRLVVVPRPLVDDALQKLAGWGMQPHCVDVADPDGTSACKVNLLPVEQRIVHQRHPRRWVKVGFAAATGLLLVSAVVVPLWQEHQTATDLLPKVTKAEKEAEQVQNVRAQLEQLIGESRHLLDKKMQSPVFVDVLNELTRVLPDDTWLSSIELKGRQVRIQGESAASSALIGLIEASPLFAGTSFSSPVTQNPTTGHERFQLSTALEARATQ
jgi:general secretion pathway protein L